MAVVKFPRVLTCNNKLVAAASVVVCMVRASLQLIFIRNQKF